MGEGERKFYKILIPIFICLLFNGISAISGYLMPNTLSFFFFRRKAVELFNP